MVAFRYDKNPDSYEEVEMSILSPSSEVLYHTWSEQGNVHITAKEDGQHDLCFNNQAKDVRLVTFQFADRYKNQHTVSREQVDPLKAQLTSLVESAAHITADMDHLKVMEWELRDLSESTNTRVMISAWVNVGTFIVAAIAKVVFLKKYFKHKKLL